MSAAVQDAPPGAAAAACWGTTDREGGEAMRGSSGSTDNLSSGYSESYRTGRG